MVIGWLVESLVATIVVCAALLLVRSRVSGQGLRDTLGISVAFVVLAYLTFAMIAGENLLG